MPTLPFDTFIMDQPARNRFFAQINLPAPRNWETECWLWTGSRTNYGYGSFSHKGKNLNAHRVAALNWYGVDCDEVRHAEGCPPHCVNPYHLTPGDRLSNAQDRKNAGPYNPGYKHVTPDERERIIKLMVEGYNRQEIVNATGRCANTVRKVIKENTCA